MEKDSLIDDNELEFNKTKATVAVVMIIGFALVNLFGG